jgi:uncharacterized membrane protein (DUF2068 family)
MANEPVQASIAGRIGDSLSIARRRRERSRSRQASASRLARQTDGSARSPCGGSGADCEREVGKLRSGLMSTAGGVRVVAVFEGAKGVLVLLAGFGLLSIVHESLQRLAEEIVRHYHLNPASRYPRIFIDAAVRLSDVRLWMLAMLAFAYAALRLVEAYGLWRERRWAEWFAVASGSIYLPIEIYELFHGLSAIKAGTLAVNLGIVLYMGFALWHLRRVPQR